MKKTEQQRAIIRTEERNSEIYREFNREFCEKILDTRTESADGIERIHLLERMMHSMNSDIIASNLKYVGEMIETIDEDGIIESKKENS